ncbi:hypothetical protein DPMN_149460 [Dreissena polymorpha]|uniref:Uncharacterized protein n=1 Tax=Dreissena polymorpha TaxID=45954 RepID=A0A9D4FEF8_DREPO|nr:hypothetical protein DPMN_149460 [Dreissena polymorpha]
MNMRAANLRDSYVVQPVPTSTVSSNSLSITGTNSVTNNTLDEACSKENVTHSTLNILGNIQSLQSQ